MGSEMSEEEFATTVQKLLQLGSEQPGMATDNEKDHENHENDNNRLNPLHAAALRGDLYAVQRFIESGQYPIDQAGEEGQRAIHLATLAGHVEVMRYLVENGSIIDSVGSGPPPLVAALASGQMEPLKFLLEKGAKTVFDFHAMNVNNDDELDLQSDRMFLVLILGAHKPLLSIEFVFIALRKAYAAHLRGNGKITAVHTAIGFSSLDSLKYLIENDPSMSIGLDEGPFSPLHVAARTGNLEILKYLHSHGPLKVNSSDGTLIPLHIATIHGYTALVEYLLKEMKANTEVKTESGFTPLHLAAIGDYVDIIKCLVRNGARLSAFDMNGDTPLHLAARQKSLASLQALIHCGAPVLTTNKNGTTALHLLTTRDEGTYEEDTGYTTSDFIVAVKLLVQQGADIRAVDGLTFTPLHTAAFYGNLETVKYLASIGADVDACGGRESIDHVDNKAAILHHRPMYKAGRWGTPLHQAVIQDQLAIVEYLLEYGAQVNLPDGGGLTPLHIAAMTGRLACAQALTQNGANINTLDQHHLTPLMLGILGEHVHVIEYLLHVGADSSIGNVEGTSPLMCCVELKLHLGPTYKTAKKFDEIIKLLLNHGADVYQRNLHGVDSIALATEHQDLELVKFLHEKGAQLSQNDGGSKSTTVTTENTGVDEESKTVTINAEAQILSENLSKMILDEAKRDAVIEIEGMNSKKPARTLSSSTGPEKPPEVPAVSVSDEYLEPDLAHMSKNPAETEVSTNHATTSFIEETPSNSKNLKGDQSCCIII